MGTRFTFAITTTLAIITGATVFAQHNPRGISPPNPEKERASFKVADGFEVHLFAADPLLAKPVQINFDADGKLWVVSSETYPQLNINQQPNDRILVLEDTNSNGVADRSTVFAEDMLIPGGVLPDGEGGAYVAHAEELILLSDKNGDGKADCKQVLLSGFGTEDTHHTLHRLRWGPDGLIYVLQGYYIGSHVETLYGPRRLDGGGLWVFDTVTNRLEIYSRGLVNPWGMVFDRWGQTFQTDGAGSEGINYSFPDAVFLASPHENRILRGLHPGRPKLCGLEIVSGAHFPISWQGSLITSDFRANNIDRYVVSEQGSGYVSDLQPDVLASSHVSFRPVDAVMGPDGALYVADWYSPIIQHGEVDFRDERRDHVHGRIWRITAQGRPLVKPVNYHSATVTKLLGQLKSDADWIRLNARQELKRRAQRDRDEILGILRRWLEELDPRVPGFEHHRLEALWAIQTLHAVDPEMLRAVLQSEDHRARAAAVRILYFWHRELSDAEQLLGNAVIDPHPQVRREAVSALGQLESATAVEVATRALDYPVDECLDFALWRTCRLLAPHWITEFQQGLLDFDGDVERLSFALQSVEDPQLLAPLVAMLENGELATQNAIVGAIGNVGNADQLVILTKLASDRDHPLRWEAARSLLNAVVARGVAPASGTAETCVALLNSPEPEIVAVACRLAGNWQITATRARLRELATHRDTNHQVRKAASASLVLWGFPEDHQFLKEVASDLESYTAGVRVAAICALVRADVPAATKAVTDLLINSAQEDHVEDLIGAILNMKGAPAALATLLEGKTIDSSIATQATRMAEISGNAAAPLVVALAKSGLLETTGTKLNRNEVAALLAKVPQGDHERGRQIYLRAGLACVKCHALNGEGGVIGPDLSSIGVSAPVDYLLESILDPGKKIKEGYRMSVITTEDGGVYSGALIREDKSTIVIRDPDGNEIRVAKSSIDDRQTSPVSMMPASLTASLGEDELVDLISFLAGLGRQR